MIRTSYQEWAVAEWLTDLESRHSQEIQLGLDRIRSVAETLHLLQPAAQVITVAGTNGKGSTVAALEQIYHRAGYRVAAYTSPHLLSFNERIRFNLTPISDSDLCLAFTAIEEGRGQIALTYFEMTTLAALWHFRREKPDVLILEVGLGGRLDATNIIDADLAIITTIDFDHQDFLGNTIESIAYEKSGILRQGKPFIYADFNPANAILEQAQQRAVSAYYLGLDYHIVEEEMCWAFQAEDQQVSHLPKPRIQLKSAAAAIMASQILATKLPVSEAQLVEAMKQVFLPGRLQLEEGEISILFDVSHNAQSAQLLAQTLKRLAPKGKVHAVFSALKDKDIGSLIVPLKELVNHWYPAYLDIKRAASVNLLLSEFQYKEIFVKICYDNPLQAFEAAQNQAQAGDLIVVYGSFYTVSQVMAVKLNRRFNETGTR